MKSQVVGFAILAITAVGCGKKSSDDTPAAADSSQYTALKTIMAAKCAGSGCHSSGGTYAAAWYSSEASFKTSLTTIQGKVSSGDMPKKDSGFTLTTDEKAKFAAYPN